MPERLGSRPVKRDLRSKLRRNLSDAAAPTPRAAPVRSGASLRAYLERRRDRLAGPPREPVDLPPGEERENEQGAFFVRSLRYPWDTVHGWFPLGSVADADWATVATWAKDEAFGAANLEQCLFLDTETTGLSGGAGTAVFLTGLGFAEADAFVVEQVFLRSFAEEPAALTHVAARLGERPLQVTFVGKSFDRHRLRNRMVLHRIESGVMDPRHLDLYYLARRAFGAVLPDCRLRTVEEQRLGLRRHDDLPGSEAPQAWIDWLHDRTGPVDRVLEHNRLDVLSLVTLLGLLGRPVSKSEAVD
jgi:uncharacterized protein YprB with RNaseH-like and TPR domain